MWYAAVTLVAVTVTTVLGQDHGWIDEVCERVRTIDSSLVKHIEELATGDKDDFLNDMREYVKAIQSFQSCVKENKDIVTDLARDILEEEGPKFHYIYDPEYIQNLTNWGETEMDECNELHKQAVDSWIDIDKVLSANKVRNDGPPRDMPRSNDNIANNPPDASKSVADEEWKEHKFVETREVSE